MTRFSTFATAGIAAISISAVLVGCGSGTKTEPTAKSSTTTTTTTTTTTETEPSATATGQHPTIQDYIKENNIAETSLRRGDPGPTVDLPVPEGWEVNNDLPAAPYGAIVYSGTAVPDNPPRILAILEKLTGNVDAQQILALAPGELQNIEGWDGPTEGTEDTLSGYDAVVLGGTYNLDGKKGMIAQKTVVIPGPDGLYVLQLNAYSDESEASVLAEATDIVDEQTTISF